METETHRILTMLKENKINIEGAEKLLNALREKSLLKNSEDLTEDIPKFLRVQVEDKKTNTDVNVRVPLQLLRSGVRLASFIPKEAQSKINEALNEKGVSINISQLKPEDIDRLIKDFSEFSVDMNAEGEKIRIFCE